VQIDDALFFMLGWDQFEFNEKCTKTRYAEFVFLHPMGSTGHVVHSSGSGMSNSNALFFMLEWDSYGFGKKCVGTHYGEHVFLYPMGYVGHKVYSGSSGVRNVDVLFFMLRWERYGFDKNAPGHIMLNLCFAAYAICRSRSAFQCVWGLKRRHAIFHARLGPVRI
jgi:hypothetical protein